MHMDKIALVGLGAMGIGMARNMLKNGLAVTGIDISAERRALFVEDGGNVAESLQDLAGTLDAVFVMVNEAEHMEAALFTNGAASRMRRGSVVVSTSTLPPSYIASCAARLGELGIGMVDSPVSGGEKGAAGGTLTLMLSGRKSDIEKVRPALDAVSKKVFDVGEDPGMGSKMKVLHQHLASTHIALTVEALGMCRKSGVDPKLFYEIVTHSAGNSFLFEYFGKFLVDNDFFPYSSINTSEKDLRLVVELARELDYPAEIATKAYEQFLHAKEKGLGKESSIATIQLFPVDWTH
ncbi:MAG: hypothetical protein A2Y31_12755 [Spirochaetes bacterium GWC2_52_13]|nr:MAG: hypothetical protein A2Y31_12755 [Spirochaetes bacterium GWC2_52_13]HCG62531.1 3-hydroxyisobutyrate dehydrogenase [Sphaerochaeta sp.]